MGNPSKQPEQRSPQTRHLRVLIARAVERLGSDRVLALVGLPGSQRAALVEGIVREWPGPVKRVNSPAGTIDIPGGDRGHASALVVIDSENPPWETVRELLANQRETAVLSTLSRRGNWVQEYMMAVRGLPIEEAAETIQVEYRSRYDDSPPPLAKLRQLAVRVGGNPALLSATACKLRTSSAQMLLQLGPPLLDELFLEHQSAHQALGAAFAGLDTASREVIDLLDWLETPVPFAVVASAADRESGELMRILGFLEASGWLKVQPLRDDIETNAYALSPVTRLFCGLRTPSSAASKAWSTRLLSALRETCHDLREARAGATANLDAMLRVASRICREAREQPGLPEAALEILAWACWLGHHRFSIPSPQEQKSALSRCLAVISAARAGSPYRELAAPGKSQSSFSAVDLTWCMPPTRVDDQTRELARYIRDAVDHDRAPEVPALLWELRHQVLNELTMPTQSSLPSVWAMLGGDSDRWIQCVAYRQAAEIAWLAGARGKAAVHLNALSEVADIPMPDSARVWLFLGLARLQFALGFADKASLSLERADVFFDGGEPRAGFEISESRAWVWASQENVEEAMRSSQSALAYARQAGVARLVGVAESMGSIIEMLDAGPPYHGLAHLCAPSDLLPEFVELACLIRFLRLENHHITNTSGVDSSELSFDRLLETSSTSGRPTVLTIEFCRNLSEARHGQASHVDELQAWIRTHAASSPEPLATASVLPVARLLWQYFGREDWLPQRAQSQPGDHSGLTVHPHGHWFHVGNSAPVDLLNRRSLRRILRHFVELSHGEDQRCADVAELIEIGWPDEVLSFESGRSRVYTAIRQLRDMGLRDILVTGDGGYRLSGRISMHVRDLTVDSARRLVDVTSTQSV